MQVRKNFSIRSGDLVQVIAGKDKGKQGKVVRIYAKTDRVLVEGVNSVKRHTRPTQKNPQGGIVAKELPIHISNVMFVDPSTGKPTRIGMKKVEDSKTKKTKYVRVAKASGTVLDGAK